MNKQSKRNKIKRIQTVLILIISLILCITLLITFNDYKNETKKVEVKESIRSLILTIEAVKINNAIEFDDSDTIYEIKNEGGEKLEAISKYKNIEDFNKIENLSLEDATKIINNEVDFEINKDGEFINVKNIK